MGKGVVSKDGITALWSDIVSGKAEWRSLNDHSLWALIPQELLPCSLSGQVLHASHSCKSCSPWNCAISCYFLLHLLPAFFVDQTVQTSSEPLYQSQDPFSTPKFLLLSQTLMLTQNRLVSCTIQTLFHFWGHHLVIISLYVPTSFLFIPSPWEDQWAKTWHHRADPIEELEFEHMKKDQKQTNKNISPV